MHYVFEAFKDSEPEIIFKGTAMECAKFEEQFRKNIVDTSIHDVWTKSDEEIEKAQAAKEFFDTLTEEDKKDLIEVNGRKFIRKAYERKVGR